MTLTCASDTKRYSTLRHLCSTTTLNIWHRDHSLDRPQLNTPGKDPPQPENLVGEILGKKFHLRQRQIYPARRGAQFSSGWGKERVVKNRVENPLSGYATSIQVLRFSKGKTHVYTGFSMAYFLCKKAVRASAIF